MEIKRVYEKVKDYLCDEIGNMAIPGEPVFDKNTKRWQVPVLCKTERGIFVTGQFLLDENINFIRIPSREQMLKILAAEMQQMPYLVYAESDELEKKGLKVVSF